MSPEEKSPAENEYQVIARKWRPQGFKDVVGQEHITRTLQNSLLTGRIAHAFLFSGLRGVGKTTTARILAKALNCHKGITDEPCEKCPSCVEIREGRSVDVQEIDGASNRGIDSIRELRESVRYGTSRDRFKIYIIDEVHMLTREAFNGLLKTLEEPPGHVKFIMATTEFYKIPPTIQSRCQKYEFRPISPQAILNHLRMVTTEEGIKISDHSLQSITTLAQGSMRDAQSALDQVISFCGTNVDDDDVKALLGVVDFRAIAGIFEAVIDQDSEKMLEIYRDLVMKGVEIEILCREMMEHVRNLMVVKIAGWSSRLLQLAETEKESLESCSSRISEPELVRFYDLLEQTAQELRRSGNPEIHLEMSLMKMIQLAKLPALERVLEQIVSGDLGEPSQAAPAPITPKKASGGGRKAGGGIDSGDSGMRMKKSGPRADTGDSRAQPVASPGDAAGEPPPSIAGLSGGDIVESWKEQVKEKSIGLYQHLNRAGRITFSDGETKTVTAFFAHQDSFHAGQVTRRKDFLQKLFKNLSGHKVKLLVEVEDSEEDEKEEGDPASDPRVQSFLKRYPGRVTVKKPS